MADSPASAEAAAAAAAAAAGAGAGASTSEQGLGDPDNYGFLYGLARAPCFRESAMYAIGGGAIMGGLQLHRHRDASRAAEMMVKTGCAFALISWYGVRYAICSARCGAVRCGVLTSAGAG